MSVEIAVKMLKNLNKVAKRRKNTLIFVLFTLINYCLHIFNWILKKTVLPLYLQKKKTTTSFNTIDNFLCQAPILGVVTARKANKKLYT